MQFNSYAQLPHSCAQYKCVISCISCIFQNRVSCRFVYLKKQKIMYPVVYRVQFTDCKLTLIDLGVFANFQKIGTKILYH